MARWSGTPQRFLPQSGCGFVPVPGAAPPAWTPYFCCAESGRGHAGGGPFVAVSFNASCQDM